MDFGFGIDTLLDSVTREPALKRARCALVGHPASVTNSGIHSLDALVAAGFNVTRAFGPQHGMRGDKQDNMIESEDYLDPLHGLPVLSLYGEHRRPTSAMLDNLDTIYFDLQDVGCRIYTYITTLKYFLEAVHQRDIKLVVLDRPNPAGRSVDGLILQRGEESFVGCDELPTRHGLTTGELGRWLIVKNKLDVDLEVSAMQHYDPLVSPHHGWPVEQPWINPSPNASSINMARCFPGTVLLEGTTLSEGRGTTTPLEVIGAPGLPIEDMLDLLQNEVPDWLSGALLRRCFFEPTFHKHAGELCRGIQIHTEIRGYAPDQFKPFRLIAAMLKACRLVKPDYPLWRHHAYEYESNRVPIDVINGGGWLRAWVDDPAQGFDVLGEQLSKDETYWLNERLPFLSYPAE